MRKRSLLSRCPTYFGLAEGEMIMTCIRQTSRMLKFLMADLNFLQAFWADI